MAQARKSPRPRFSPDETMKIRLLHGQGFGIHPIASALHRNSNAVSAYMTELKLASQLSRQALETLAKKQLSAQRNEAVRRGRVRRPTGKAK
jgi:hypothetical protein